MGFSVKQISASYTRPANTTTYAAQDVLSNSTSAPTALTFAGMASANGKGGVIIDAVMMDEANQALPIVCELWLFTAAPTAVNDNAAFALSNSDLEKFVGMITFTPSDTGGAGSGSAGNCAGLIPGLELGFQAGASDVNLYGLVKVLNAYVPISGEKFVFSLKVAQEV